MSDVSGLVKKFGTFAARLVVGFSVVCGRAFIILRRSPTSQHLPCCGCCCTALLKMWMLNVFGWLRALSGDVQSKGPRS